jgi:hypothetical protein
MTNKKSEEALSAQLEDFRPLGYQRPPADPEAFGSHKPIGPGTCDPESIDPVNHPSHYTNHPSGVECIQITEHMNFNLGNALKYIWRADLKGKSIEDLRKARFYIEREIALRIG